MRLVRNVEQLSRRNGERTDWRHLRHQRSNVELHARDVQLPLTLRIAHRLFELRHGGRLRVVQQPRRVFQRQRHVGDGRRVRRRYVGMDVGRVSVGVTEDRLSNTLRRVAPGTVFRSSETRSTT